MPEFRIRMEFDVEVDNPSHIDAAFAAADWLQERAAESRFSYLVYEVASHHDLKDGEGTQFKTVDLEEIAIDAEPDGHSWPDREYEACTSAGEHLMRQRHRWQECPTNHDGA